MLDAVPPDLEESVDIQIQAENLKAAAAIYFAYQLEQMRLFQVVDQIVTLFGQELLPLTGNSLPARLIQYAATVPGRMTEAERRNLYASTFGARGGDALAEPNRHFNTLWLRFVSEVSDFARQQAAEQHRGARIAVTREQIRKAARDLGANLSRGGVSRFAAAELKDRIDEVRDILGDRELQNAFGVHDMWEVVDAINVKYLGGARNIQRHRTQGETGVVIIRWLAGKVALLDGADARIIAIEPAEPCSAADLELPEDWELVDACERWLALGSNAPEPAN